MSVGIVQTPSPKKPIKKRKVSTTSTTSPTPAKKITPPSKKSKKTKSKRSNSPSELHAVSPEQAQHLSSRALFLSQAIEAEPSLYRTLLLHMALERETPRKASATTGTSPANSSNPTNSKCISPGEVSIGKKRGNQYVEGVRTLVGESSSKVITDGFFWKVRWLDGFFKNVWWMN